MIDGRTACLVPHRQLVLHSSSLIASFVQDQLTLRKDCIALCCSQLPRVLSEKVEADLVLMGNTVARCEEAQEEPEEQQEDQQVESDQDEVCHIVSPFSFDLFVTYGLLRRTCMNQHHLSCPSSLCKGYNAIVCQLPCIQSLRSRLCN